MSKAFAKNMKVYRQLMGMTQEDLARSLGITRASVANYELGRNEPSFELLCALTSVLGVDANMLLKETDQYPNFIRTAQVTDEESAVLQAYREADPVYQNVVLDILRQHKRSDP